MKHTRQTQTSEWTKQASYQGMVGVACLWLACRTHRTRGSLSTERALKIYLTFCLSVFLSICLFVFVSLSLFVFLYTGILKFTWQAIFQDLSLIILHTPIFLVAMYKEKMTIDWTHTDVVYCKQESAEWCNQLAQVLIVTKRKTARRWWGFPACKLSDNKILMTSPIQQVVAPRGMSLETCTRVKYKGIDPDLMVQGKIQVAIVQH